MHCGDRRTMPVDVTNKTRDGVMTPADVERKTPAFNAAVLFIDDVARLLRTSRSTIERRRRAGTFPIPELPGIDGRPRWSGQALERYLSSTPGWPSRRGRPAGRSRS